MIAGMMDGKTVHLVKSVKKFRLKLPVIKMLVGFDDTRTADAVLAAMNSLKTHGS